MLDRVEPRDIERVRVAMERSFRWTPPAPRRLALEERERAAVEMRSRGLPLTPDIAPSVHAALAVVRARLAVADEVEVCQIPVDQEQHWNAYFVARHEGLVSLTLVGPLLDVIDDGALRAILGHELGHALAHPPHDEARMNRRHDLARELTADRFGVLAEPDVMATVRAQMASASGARSTSARLDASAYLRWCLTTAQDALARGGDFHGTTHPEHCVRVYAVARFAETDLFRELTGEGTGERAIDEVNETVERMVRAAVPDVIAPHARAPRTEPAAPLDTPTPARSPARVVTPTPVVSTSSVLTDLASAASAASSRVRETAIEAAARYVGRAPPRIRVRAEPAAGEESETVDPMKADLLARFAELERKLAERERKG